MGAPFSVWDGFIRGGDRVPGLLELRNNHCAFWAVQDLLLCPNKQTQKTAEEGTEPWPSLHGGPLFL